MKNMTANWLFVLMMPLLQLTGLSQENVDRLTIPLSDPSRPSVLKIALASGGITITGYDGKEMIVEASLSHKQPGRTKKSSGSSQQIPQMSTGLKAEEENNTVTLTAGQSPHDRRIDFLKTVDLVVRVPINTSLNVSTLNMGSIVIDSVNGDLEASNQNGRVNMTHISGSAVVDVMNGDIIVTFVKVNPQKPMSFSVLTGKIDVSFPPDLKAVFLMKTEGGEVYSDFDVRIEEYISGDSSSRASSGGKYVPALKNGARGIVNGGGAEIRFNNFVGDTYIRKTK